MQATRRKSTRFPPVQSDFVEPSLDTAEDGDDDGSSKHHHQASSKRISPSRAALAAILFLAVVAMSFMSDRGEIATHGTMVRQTTTSDRLQQPSFKNHIPPPAADTSDCSCLSSNDDEDCCDRKILRAHKMGVVLIRELLQGIPSEIIHPNVLPQDDSMDYRHVVVTRPWYDSIISGYLYHKSGAECWLDQNGRPRLVNKTFDWESNLRYPPQPPSRNRTLCQYLAEESEEDGMRAYVDFSLSDLYKGLLPHRELVQARENTDSAKTLFVCFADLESNTEATYQTIMNFLYPKGDYSFPKLSKHKAKNDGTHGTSRNQALRTRLRAIIEKVDRELFEGIGARGTKEFGCEQ